MPTRPLPDDRPDPLPEPGRGTDVPKEPGPAPGPEDPQEEEEREAGRDEAAGLIGSDGPLDPRGGGSAGAGS
jgi:hypothetical protein